MTVKTPKIRLETPSGDILPGRGFYQLEEDALYVQVGPFRRGHRFFSYLEAPHVRMEFDKAGCLAFIEVSKPRRQWPVDDKFKLPGKALPADIRWLDFRENMKAPTLATDSRKRHLLLRFSKTDPSGCYYLANHVLIQTDSDNNLVAIWVTDIIDDLAGREISAFRKGIRQQ